MSDFPRSPQVQKGAIVGLDPFNPLASIIVFQYNPDTLTRTIRPRQGSGAGGQRQAAGDVLRLQGPPTETISLDIELDATDQLEDGTGTAASMGVYPALSALEMLLYPKSIQVIANGVLAAVGLIEVLPTEAPLTLLVWGIQRVVPVKIDSLTITEQFFDPSLNPIRAKASVSMTVLSYHDFGLLSVGGGIFMAHQIIKEVMATVNGVNNVVAGVSGSFEVG